MTNLVANNRTLASRAPLPEGTLPVGAALLVAGVATYLFFKIGPWAVGGDEEFEPISAMWFAMFALAPGFFLPLEQELGRAISARQAMGQGSRPVVAKVTQLGAVLAVIVVVGIFAASPAITSNYFDGDWLMLVALVVAFAGYAPAHIARGVCSGHGRFRHYGLIMGADGVVRIAAVVLLAVIGVTAAGAYGFALALTPLLTVLFVWWRRGLHVDPGPEATVHEVSQNLGWLLLGTVCAAALLNAGPVTASLLATEAEKGGVTNFGQGVLLARVPLFLFQAVQAALLPRLSRLAARGEFDEFRNGYRKLIIVVVTVGVVGTTGAYLIGPQVAEMVYGADLSGRTLAMLALGSSCYMVALATGQAVVALHGHVLVAFGWLVGVIAFLLGTWLSSDQLFRRIEIGLVLSSIAAMLTFIVALRYKLSRGESPDTDSVLEALTDLPLET